MRKQPMANMTRAEIAAYQPDSPAMSKAKHLLQARQTMQAAGCWSPNQQMGSRWPIGCVALEITQRCNLDCTLCYLSEHSEAVHDIPLVEIWRRIDLIDQYYGKNTDVQISGGEPTLRDKSELLAIVRRLRELGMRPTLMTNGKRVTRSLLEALVDAGLMDIAFHIDTTQQLKGYASEIELNVLRQRYIDRAAGLPVSVFFNTTIHQGNFYEIPDLVRFFQHNASKVRTVSFQLQADTGRGAAGPRDVLITPDSVIEQIQQGTGTRINFSASLTGHPSCNRYGLCLIVNGTCYDLLDDAEFIGRIQTATAHLTLDRAQPYRTVLRFACWLVSQPRYWVAVSRWMMHKLWRMKKDLWLAKGRVQTLSFFIHNFMDAEALDPERIHACVFKTMTQQGPISMCLHNAKRDEYILQPIALPDESGKRFWQPLSGQISTNPTPSSTGNNYSPKRFKGRLRKQWQERNH